MPFEKIALSVPSITLASIAVNATQMRKYTQLIRGGGGSGQWASFMLSCMQQIMEGDLPALVGPNGVSLFREVESGTLDTKAANLSALKEDISGLIYRIGFMGMLHLFKEITKENGSYPEKRWQAFTASSRLKLGDWVSAYEGDPTQNVASISVGSVTTAVLQQAAKRVDIPKALKTVLRKIPGAESPTVCPTKASCGVFRYVGCTPNVHMRHWAHKPCNSCVFSRSG